MFVTKFSEDMAPCGSKTVFSIKTLRHKSPTVKSNDLLLINKQISSTTQTIKIITNLSYNYQVLTYGNLSCSKHQGCLTHCTKNYAITTNISK